MSDLCIKRITKDDTFQFQCSRCTSCCRNVYQTIMVSTYDVFRIARFENRCMEEIVTDYTEPVLISKPPTIPIMMLKTIGKASTCILLEKRKCRIQEAKPMVCRLYPLNLEPAKGLNRLIPVIVSQKSHHYIGKAHEVGTWIQENFDADEENITLWWYRAASEIAKVIKEVNAVKEKQEERIARLGIIYLYLNYDGHKDFLPQFIFNINHLLKELRQNL